MRLTVAEYNGQLGFHLHFRLPWRDARSAAAAGVAFAPLPPA